MKNSRRQFLKMAAGAAVLSTFPRSAFAETYPTRPIHLVVGFPPGGSVDIVARLIGQQLSDQLGQPVVIENRAGASGNIAAAAFIQAPSDGYTLLQITSANSWNTALYQNLKFDFIKDIEPVASIYRGFGVLVVQPSFPATTLQEFIAYTRRNPGKLRMASSGVGAAQHLYGSMFNRMTGLEMLHVPYRGGAPALTDLLGGHVDVMFDTLTTSIGHIKAGELRALGVTSAKRLNVLPDVPAIGEVVSGYEASAYQGIGAPKNTPPDIINRLNKEVNLALAGPSFQKRLTELGAEPFETASPSDFRKFVGDYTEKWANLIREVNITAE